MAPEPEHPTKTHRSNSEPRAWLPPPRCPALAPRRSTSPCLCATPPCAACAAHASWIASSTHSEASYLPRPPTPRPLSATRTLTRTLSHTSHAPRCLHHTPVSAPRLHEPPARRICVVDSLTNTQRSILPASAPVLSLCDASPCDTPICRPTHRAPYSFAPCGCTCSDASPRCATLVRR